VWRQLVREPQQIIRTDPEPFGEPDNNATTGIFGLPTDNFAEILPGQLNLVCELPHTEITTRASDGNPTPKLTTVLRHTVTSFLLRSKYTSWDTYMQYINEFFLYYDAFLC
jgi:hypothetical protein